MSILMLVIVTIPKLFQIIIYHKSNSILKLLFIFGLVAFCCLSCTLFKQTFSMCFSFSFCLFVFCCELF
jgi:hypothetical protein